jgi:hypothetical protein
MEHHHQSDLLNKVNRVPVPDHLLEGINTRIQATNSRQIPFRWAVAASLAIGLWCSANVWLIAGKYRPVTSSGDMAELIQGLQLNNSNQLYDE